MANKKDSRDIIKWWKNLPSLEDWLFSVKEAVNSNLYTTETYKKQRLNELKIYESFLTVDNTDGPNTKRKNNKKA